MREGQGPARAGPPPGPGRAQPLARRSEDGAPAGEPQAGRRADGQGPPGLPRVGAAVGRRHRARTAAPAQVQVRGRPEEVQERPEGGQGGGGALCPGRQDRKGQVLVRQEREAGQGRRGRVGLLLPIRVPCRPRWKGRARGRGRAEVRGGPAKARGEVAEDRKGGPKEREGCPRCAQEDRPGPGGKPHPETLNMMMMITRRNHLPPTTVHDVNITTYTVTLAC
mmetsp:Transcript_2093/g.6485  ORF Transcript_2093/g.6485 Transcript_2093/m.6485 type:complete len:223 (+) Transcript_2093:2535-3203(+)